MIQPCMFNERHFFRKRNPGSTPGQGISLTVLFTISQIKTCRYNTTHYSFSGWKIHPWGFFKVGRRDLIKGGTDAEKVRMCLSKQTFEGLIITGIFVI